MNRITKFFVTLFLVTVSASCSAKSSTDFVDETSANDSQNSTNSLFPIVRNNTTIAEAAVTLGCMGEAKSAPVNLQQFDSSKPTFDSLYYLPARPWLVKLEEAGVASGRLVYAPNADQAFIDSQVRAYDMPSEAFATAAFLEPKWSAINSIWRDSLVYGLERVNAGRSDLDVATEIAMTFGPEIKSICKISIESTLGKASAMNLPFSSYLYVQTAEYLPSWFPDFFTVSSLEEFLVQFDIRDN